MLSTFHQQIFTIIPLWKGFLGSSAVKESTCNTGDPRSGRSAGEGIGYPSQYSWTSPVAQMIKNLPAKQETWVWTLKIPWRREQLPTPVFWPGEVHGAAKSQIQLNNFQFRFPCERHSAKQYQGLRDLSTLQIVTIWLRCGSHSLIIKK